MDDQYKQGNQIVISTNPQLQLLWVFGVVIGVAGFTLVKFAIDTRSLTPVFGGIGVVTGLVFATRLIIPNKITTVFDPDQQTVITSVRFAFREVVHRYAFSQISNISLKYLRGGQPGDTVAMWEMMVDNKPLVFYSHTAMSKANDQQLAADLGQMLGITIDVSDNVGWKQNLYDLARPNQTPSASISLASKVLIGLLVLVIVVGVVAIVISVFK